MMRATPLANMPAVARGVAGRIIAGSEVCAAQAAPLVVLVPRAGSAARSAFAREVARLAVRSLHAELCLYPKPGLVSPVDSGSHDDMDAGTFMRSMFALRHYFRQICLAGWDDAPFAQLKQLGIAAEAAMLKATHGINTHRGAIFSLGMLCATAGRARAQGTSLRPAALRAAMLIRWGEELAAHAAGPAAGPLPSVAPPAQAAPAVASARDDGKAAVDEGLSNGLRVAARYAVSGAREEGALGLPSVFEIGIPALLASRARGATVTEERVDTLYALMAHISDSNVYHRAGPPGAQIVRDHAERFLAHGGTANVNWYADALHSHHVFMQHRLSPGGAADLLAACCLVQSLATLDDK
ncbi:triphosphoribosyl-dephospho-CoA synthase [Duganella sp.]|uniref:triphosphoribosyl-dephospho-CoA synthase n=1 Tax=Duganella sp. TaxID=1904440 RepID=UPI0031DBB813